MKLLTRIRPGLKRGGVALLLTLTISAVMAGTALAASYTYMNGDSLAGGADRNSAACRSATTSYGHRLDGPQSDPMQVSALHSNSYCNIIQITCWNSVNYDEAYCYPGGVYTKGNTWNKDSNTHSFNAHLTY